MKLLILTASVLLSTTIYADGFTMIPDGSYVSGDSYHIAPDGTYQSGDSSSLTPDGSYVGN